MVAQLLELKNKQFTSELIRNQNKTVKFQYSKFSPFTDLIKQDKHGNLLMKDVTSFLQTNLIKLYVEQGDKDSVYKFFELNKK